MTIKFYTTLIYFSETRMFFISSACALARFIRRQTILELNESVD